MSQNKGVTFLDLYWEFDGKLHLFEDGLHLNSEVLGYLVPELVYSNRSINAVNGSCMFAMLIESMLIKVKNKED